MPNSQHLLAISLSLLLSVTTRNPSAAFVQLRPPCQSLDRLAWRSSAHHQQSSTADLASALAIRCLPVEPGATFACRCWLCMAHPQARPADASANMSSSDSEARDSGDLLNAVGSTSSLASTVSSVFSANTLLPKTNGHSSTTLAALTSMTLHASSPVKAPSPLASSIPQSTSSRPEPSPLGRSVANSARGPRENATLRPSPSGERPQIMPPAGKTKGYRTVYDPGMERGLSDEEKKTRKTKLRSFGTEVRPDNFTRLLSLLTPCHKINRPVP